MSKSKRNVKNLKFKTMGKNIFSKSENFKSEYCCSIIKVGEIKPIEGKDKIGYTLVNGETIVIRKDQVKEGDILFYASNETQLHKDFLGANNLFESSSYLLNSNANEIEPYILKNKELKEQVELIEKMIEKVKRFSNVVTTFEADMFACENDSEREHVKAYYNNACKRLVQYVKGGLNINSKSNDFIIEAEKFVAIKKVEIESLKKEIENNTEFIRGHVGFFNKTGRVRAIKLGGVRSMGYLFSIDELVKYNSKVKDVNLEELIGEDFDTVDGELFVKAYVPFVPEQRKRSKLEKINKKIEKFDRMINGEFSFHFDTDPLPKCINLIKPTDCVSISYKLHGTSFICGKVHVKMPISLPIHKWLWNKFIDLTGLFKSHRITDYVIEYGNVTSSRKVIKNQYINKDVKDGFYSVDVYLEYGDLIYPYLDEGMILYGEICGYETGKDKWIQPQYDYGCDVGENFLMPYRITTTNEDGSKKEWNVQDVYDWTVKLITEHPELSNKIHPITIAYHGTLKDLYPDLSLTEHWHENLLERMRNDTKHFHMEKNCPLCKNKVPFEGIVLRIDDDENVEAFKLKSYRFIEREKKAIDNGEVDMEMIDAYTE